MKYSKDQILAARQTDLVEWLRKKGYALKKEGKDFRLLDFESLLVRDNRWKDFYSGAGGNTVDFLVEVAGMSFIEALGELVGHGGFKLEQLPQLPLPVSEGQAFGVPEKNKDYRRVIAYLTQTRQIPVPLVVSLIREDLLWQDQRGNCVFPCRDGAGNVVGAMLRGTLSERRWVGITPGSSLECGWVWPGSSNALVVTESPIEAMSLKVVRPELGRYTFLGLGGLHQCVLEATASSLRPSCVILALNSDQEGQKAAYIFKAELEADYNLHLIFPHTWDWNDDLIYSKDSRWPLDL